MAKEKRSEEPESSPASDCLVGKLIAIRQKVRSDALRSGDTNSPILYHYTNPDGLIGILSHGRLRATSIRHFDDKSELLYAERIYEQVLDEIKEQFPLSSLQSRLAEACHIEPDPALPRAGPLSPRSGKRSTWINKVLDMYVACFSTGNDILNQWEKYARRGAGFAIGFDRRELEKVIQPPKNGGIAAAENVCENIHWVEVRYSVNTQKRELRDIFDQCCSAMSATAPPSGTDINSCADEIVNALALHANLFKDPYFAPEKEWRIIIETLPGRSDLCFRSSADKVIPYIETAKQESGRLPVASITIGAAMDQEASAGGVRALLDMKGYRRVKIHEAKLQLSLTDLNC
jgi:hypothetical protein